MCCSVFFMWFSCSQWLGSYFVFQLADRHAIFMLQFVRETSKSGGDLVLTSASFK